MSLIPYLIVFVILLGAMFVPFFALANAPSWDRFWISFGLIGGGILLLFFVLTILYGLPSDKLLRFLFIQSLISLTTGGLVGAVAIHGVWSNAQMLFLKLGGFAMLLALMFLAGKIRAIQFEIL